MKAYRTGPSTFLLKIAGAIQSTGLTVLPRKVLVAVSGGVDSMTLLHVLSRISEPWGWTLGVVHLDHLLRGRSSRQDAHLVGSIAKQHGFPLFEDRMDVKSYSREQGISLEMAGRAFRHQLYDRAASEFGANIVALGHHADDQVELLFLRLLRGSGGEGIAGMKLLSPMPARPELKLLRPMLGVERSQILEYARTERIAFREDATNTDPSFLRNRIRTELLPLLASKYQPALTANVLRVIDLVGAEADLAKTMAQEWLSSEKRMPFTQLHRAIQRQVIQLQLLSHGVLPEYQLIEHLRASTNPANLPKGSRPGKPHASVGRNPDGLLYWPTVEQILFSPGAESLQITVSGSAAVSFAGVAFEWELTQAAEGLRTRTRLPQTEYFDAAKVGSHVRLRKWRSGDRFQPIGMPNAVKLQDLFTNLKVPRSQRHALVLAESETGQIFWIEGMRISEPHKVTDQTKRVLKWHWQRC